MIDCLPVSFLRDGEEMKNREIKVACARPASIPSGAPRRAGSRVTFMIAAGLVAAVTLAYAGSFAGPFVFDDWTGIAGNKSLHHLWPLWDALRSPPKITTSGRPIANLSFALNYAISGNGVWSYHVLNLLIHAAATVVLFGVARRTLESPVLRERFGRDAVYLAAAIAALWGLHPLQTEAVTYIVQRVESLMGLFFLLTFYCFARSAGSDHPTRWGLAAVLACLGGTGTKEVIVCAPFLLIFYDRAFFAGSFAEVWRRRKGLHFALLATWIPLVYLVASTGWDRGGSAGFNVGVRPGAYWLTQFQAVARYLQLALWPAGQAFEYGTFWVKPAQALPYALLILPLVGATWYALWCRPILGFLGAWILVILSPTSVVPGTFQMIVEHRMYLPLAAICAALVVAAYTAARRLTGNPGSALGWTMVLSVLAATALGSATSARNAVYHSDLTLWADTAEKCPGNDRAFNNLGNSYLNRNQLPEAIAAYRQAIRLSPLYPEAHNNLSVALLRSGQMEEAVRQARNAVTLQPRYANAHDSLGDALLALGRKAEAMAEFETAIQIDPDDPQASLNIGNMLLKNGRMEDAIPRWEKLLQGDPGNVEDNYELGNALMQAGRAHDAIARYQKALQGDPAHVNAHDNLGNALLAEGRMQEAVAEFQTTVRLAPDDPFGHNNLGAALVRLGRVGEATAEFTRALALKPDYADARRNLDAIRGPGAGSQPGSGENRVQP